VSGCWAPSVKRFETMKVTYFSNVLVSMLKTIVYEVQERASVCVQRLPIMRFSTLVVRLGCNPLGAARSGPTPSNRWPSGVTATLCNWIRPKWYESRTLDMFSQDSADTEWLITFPWVSWRQSSRFISAYTNNDSCANQFENIAAFNGEELRCRKTSAKYNQTGRWN
jgi:hypothetical protein